jgi:hypothetical protein
MSYSIDLGPNYAGSYVLGSPYGFHVSQTKKPIWIHRVMMRLCLGFIWVDA